MQVLYFFFFNDTATTEIYTLSLHDALPIYLDAHPCCDRGAPFHGQKNSARDPRRQAIQDALPGQFAKTDRKSTRLNSSHDQISYAVFCLKKKRLCLTFIRY